MERLRKIMYPLFDEYEDCDDIQYSFIRLGEDIEDIENRKNWTDDIPSEIEYFGPIVDISDEDKDYTPVALE